jgi:hypothetical protein
MVAGKAGALVTASTGKTCSADSDRSKGRGGRGRVGGDVHAHAAAFFLALGSNVVERSAADEAAAGRRRQRAW